MTSSSKTIDAEAVGTFFADLLGLTVEAKPIESLPDQAPFTMACYVNSEDVVSGHIACDLASAAILGASLTQVPMGGVEDAIENNELSATLIENLSEVFNISVNLIPEADHHRLVMKEIKIKDGVSFDVAENWQGVQLDIQRYGQCSLFIA